MGLTTQIQQPEGGMSIQSLNSTDAEAARALETGAEENHGPVAELFGVGRVLKMRI